MSLLIYIYIYIYIYIFIYIYIKQDDTLMFLNNKHVYEISKSYIACNVIDIKNIVLNNVKSLKSKYISVAILHL